MTAPTLDEQIKQLDARRHAVWEQGADPQERAHQLYRLLCEAIATLRSVKQAEPVAWGMPNTAITGKRHALMMVSLDIPSNDQYGGAMWVPLYAAPQPAAAPDGWVVTEEMVDAYHEASKGYFDDPLNCDKREARRIGLQAALAAAPAAPPSHKGRVAVTIGPDGNVVAVTRQDEDRRVMSVIWEKPEPLPVNARRFKAAPQSMDYGDPMNNWLMKPCLEWLEQAEHGENKQRCQMIADILRDLWCRQKPLEGIDGSAAPGREG